jgi:DNA-binding GntR family transcriptional regulator
MEVHTNMVAAIRDRDAATLEKMLAQHHEDMVRVR